MKLSDALEMPNLRQRAFDYLGARLARFWYGEPLEAPEATTPREARIFLIYTGLTCLFILWLLWKLLENEPGTLVTVDLVNRTVQASDITAPFQIDDYTRWRLLEGLDDVSLTLEHVDEIAAYEDGRPSWLPTTITPAAAG